MKPKISIITLGVSDLRRSLSFYRDGLGFPTHDYQEDQGIVFFALEGTWLSLYPKQELAKDADLSFEDGAPPSVALAHNVGSPEEVNAIVEQAVNAGATLIKQPEKAFWGGYSGVFADPDGYRWEVAYNPFFDVT